ncbi:unnamed protein product [Rotaria magnacalcarata]|uniref:F-box domain-containing protein n=1 Tax=Rotaria magnacalcarata TaxID=392030 RepID=A0A819SE27_9BILA|nr:unnamed protein product [Rotaria magnacalcarata]CAF4060702.1 unnamed protein product [Rotaria magnacalcarata]
MCDECSPTLFEHLPVELIEQIFTLLTPQHVISAFSGLNYYIDSIIQSMANLKLTVRVNVVNDITILKNYPSRIIDFVMKYNNVDFTSLISLRSLYLQNPSQKQMNSIRSHHFPTLGRLTISGRDLESKRKMIINFIIFV